MSLRELAWAVFVAFGAAGCATSSSPTREPTPGRIILAVTIDWEGADFSPEGLDAFDKVREGFQAPITHFVSAAYFTKASPDPAARELLTESVRAGDEVAVHLHAWRTLSTASRIEPRLSPSFLTGTDELLQFEDEDAGFDTDLDTYSVADLRALLRTSRHRLEQTGVRVSQSFRAGGYLGTPKMLQAIRSEGFTVDSSAIDHRQLEELTDTILPNRLRELWPSVDTTSQPFLIDRHLLEMPIAAFADYSTAPQIVATIEAAHGRLAKQPGRDVFVVLGFHLETAGDFGARLDEALDTVRGRRELDGVMHFTTIENAAELARNALTPAPS